MRAASRGRDPGGRRGALGGCRSRGSAALGACDRPAWLWENDPGQEYSCCGAEYGQRKVQWVFYTDEVLRGGKRIGFDVVTIPDGRRGVLSRKSREGRYAACPRVGAYSVDVSAFEQLALPTLSPPDDPENTIVVIDEIGRMELKSDAFKNAVEKLLGDPRRRVFGAIRLRQYTGIVSRSVTASQAWWRQLRPIASRRAIEMMLPRCFQKTTTCMGKSARNCCEPSGMC